jgi:hypothetical protein
MVWDPNKAKKGEYPMRTKKKLLVVSAGLACCAVVVWFSTSIQGVEKTYEIQPHVTLPEYRTDAARAIDAYERLMERYMDLTEMNMIRVGMDVQDFGRRLDSIDNKLAEICARLSRIEKALDIEQPKPEAKTKLQSGPASGRAGRKPPRPGKD